MSATRILYGPKIKAIVSASKLNFARYGDLLKRFAPKVIESAEENRRALQIVEHLMLKVDGKRSAEENAVLGLLASLIEQFECRAYPTPAVDPKDLLCDLMEHNGLRPADLAGVMGGRSRVSDVLSGKRSISREQARRLGEHFRISPAAFWVSLPQSPHTTVSSIRSDRERVSRPSGRVPDSLRGDVTRRAVAWRGDTGQHQG